ncbi:hypothetical protein LXA43DRAFT_714290 [Ganoderma leucocontextum]|nr:hypothetical protein LXA43DRAFT_714290 [Ganoderma leucocontextum]
MGDAYPSVSAQVLTNIDLLHGIFTFMPFAPDNRDSYLARCATVSHTFHEPAIRVLWRNLRSLVPLWHLLAPSNTPFAAQYFSTSWSTDVLKYLQKVISAQLYRDPIRWDRFLRHAAHSVIMQNGGTTILPLLRSILWLHPVDDTLILFFTPTLRHATFTFMGPVKTKGAILLRRLRHSAPFLEKIDLDPGLEPDVALALIQELACFSQLQEVEISRCWGLEAFRILATKPGLVSLSIPELIGPWVGPCDLISVGGLRELSVSGDISSLSCLFSLVRFHALKSANIIVDSSETETELTAAEIISFLALFYNAVSTSGLQNFEFNPWPQRIKPSFDVVPALHRLIAPILPIRDLRSFTLVAKYPVASLDDADIVALASAWPKLEHLSVDRGFTSKSSVSINGLHCLHRHCTDLRELSIRHIHWPMIGVDTIPAPLDRSRAHPLRAFSLPSQMVVKTALPLFGADLSDEGVEAMARYLLDLFPRLDLQQCKRIRDESIPRQSGKRFGTNKARRGGVLPDALHFDDRWSRVIGHIYTLCCARDGL